MKNFNFYLVLTVALGFSVSSLAKTPTSKKRTPSAVQPKVELTVVHGEKTSTFQLVHQKGGNKLLFSSNHQKSKQIKVSQKNYEYLMAKVSEIGEPQKTKLNCVRSVLTVHQVSSTDGGKLYQACIGSQSPREGQITDIANLMAALL